MSLSSSLGRRSLGFAAALLVLAVAFLGLSAIAQADTLKLAGGYTQLTTAPATTKALVANRILPLPLFPSWVVPTQENGQLALRYRFYITGGQLDAATLEGEIYHSGGLRFANLKNGKSLAVRDFTIDTVNDQLTAYLPALGGRAPILNLDPNGYKVSTTPGSPYTKVGPVPATLS
ncbi:MAG: hypothetical protein NTX16_11595 [Actinobacteria bacterium]|nr:hypothetical protein [Actinomycetota bacterium]